MAGNLKVNEAKKEILSKLNGLEKILKISDDDSRLIEELDFELFLKILSFKTAQFNAPCYERRLILKGCKKIPANKNCGDFIFPNILNNIEFKMSFPNKASKINIRQIRLWQNCDYVICYCDYLNGRHLCYYLTHEQMEKEVNKRGSATHGTKIVNEQNKNIEYSITLDINNTIWDKYIADDKLKNFIFS